MKRSLKIYSGLGSCIIILVAFSMLNNLAIGVFNTDMENNISTTSVGSFNATIEFTLYEGEGCGCDELQDILIFADGQDNDHDVGAYTDYRGYCSLELEIDSTYRISIDDEDYQSVLFDILIVDDQVFTFHLTKSEVSVPQDLIVSRTVVEGRQLYSKALN
jgi:hypothetical protein